MSSKNIFICYRRDDAEGYPRLLRDRLNTRFPGRIFMDVISIAPGSDFTAVIQDRVGRCHALVAVIGRDWLTPDSSGQRRIDHPEDYVRKEIAAALARNHVAVLPVLVRNAQMPTRSQLPPDIASLSVRNAIEITEEDFDHDVERLIKALEFHFEETQVAQPPPRPKSSRTTCVVLAVIGVLVFFGMIVGLFVLGALSSLSESNPNQSPPPAAESSVAFNPEGEWLIRLENHKEVTVTFNKNRTYQTSDSSGKWSLNGNKLSMDGMMISIHRQTENGFAGEAEQNGETFGVELIPVAQP